jgi:hypothetical protein
MPESLFELDPTPAGFQMQSWSKDDNDDRGWTAMEAGVAPTVWQPRATREEAVHKCLEWTGLTCIPAMRVVDLSTGTVLWQDTSWYPDAGESIIPDWARLIYAQVKTEQQTQMAAELAASGVPHG